MTLYKKRERFSELSERLGMTLGKLGLGANAYTALALVFSVVSAYFLLAYQFIYAALFFALAAFFDMVDGAVARYRKEGSKTGAYLDTVSDRYMEGIIIIAIILLGLPPLYLPSYFWASLYLFGSMTVTYVKAAAKEKELTKKEIRGGLLERPERMILLFLGILAANFYPIYLAYMLVLLAILANITALQRISIAMKSVK